MVSPNVVIDGHPAHTFLVLVHTDCALKVTMGLGFSFPGSDISTRILLDQVVTIKYLNSDLS